jgi:hypothetical protein
MAADILTIADAAGPESHRLQAIIEHLGLPEVEIEGDDGKKRR